MYLVALDPGQTTGILVVPSEEDPWKMRAMQIGPQGHYRELLSLLDGWRPEVVLAESFVYTGNTMRELISCEYIGVIKLFDQMRRGRTTTVWQNSSTGKQFWDNDKLREYNVWLPGMKHARDALRHYLYYRTFTLKDQSLLKGDVGVELTGQPASTSLL